MDKQEFNKIFVEYVNENELFGEASRVVAETLCNLLNNDYDYTIYKSDTQIYKDARAVKDTESMYGKLFLNDIINKIDELESDNAIVVIEWTDYKVYDVGEFLRDMLIYDYDIEKLTDYIFDNHKNVVDTIVKQVQDAN